MIMITVNELVEELTSFNAKLLTQEYDRTLTGVEKIATYNWLKVNKNTLYVTDSYDLAKHLSDCFEVTLLFITNKPVDKELISQLDNHKCTLIICDSSSGTDNLQQRLQLIFDETYAYLRLHQSLYDTIGHSQTLNEILNYAEHMFKNPVLMIDSNFKVIDHSKNKRIVDPIWLKICQRGYCSYEFVKEVISYQSVLEAPESEQPFTVICHKSKTRKLVSKIIFEGKLYGFMIVLETNTTIPHYKEVLLSDVSKVVSNYLRGKITLHLDVEEKLVIDLIEGQIKTDEELAERRKAGKYLFGKTNRLLLIKSKGLSREPRDSIEKALYQIFPRERQVIYQEYLLVLITSYSEEIGELLTNERLINTLENHNLTAIISEVFKVPLELKEVYEQLVKSFEITERLTHINRLMWFRDIKFYNLINFDLQAKTMRRLCQAELIELQQIDQQEHTDYYHTLFVFLQHNGSISRTADALYIHRNTLQNRMKKIRQVLKLDLEDGETMFQLMYSFKLLQLMDS